MSKNLPPNRFYAFPLTMGSSWDQTIEIQTVSFGVEHSVTVNEHSEVDGWGTLITPAGSAPCIRMRKTTTIMETGKTATTTDNYFFLTNGNIAASISYSSEIEGAIIATHSTLGGTGGTGTAVEELPTPDFRLTQNFPNPFSRTTTIAFELDGPSDAQLRVFDLMGREVARLVDGPLPAGSHRAELGTEGLTSGVYVYKLEVGGLVSMRTLTILK
ncbi:MAG TPA: T9SS type A sorting domain-containing protein [Rhodothermales bacterium]|nr:T9SS type A sorting domain-containing protein [Rhodothermales bacterium]